MSYAHRPDIYDADTHMMERPDWIADFADKDIRDRLEPIVEGDEDTLKRIDDSIKKFNERQSSSEVLNKAKDELDRITLNDSLTGLANRSHFDSYLEQEWARAMRSKQPLSLIMVEVDYFTQFNDYYGHPSGDSCLKLVASILENTVKRATDLVVRYDKEEFAIILPDIDSEEASIIAERCRENIGKAEISNINSSVAEHVTISVGCSTITPEANSNRLSLINRVNEALYKAKSSGRNQSHTL